ncbi:MAG: ParB/RepB/Spo0J family partition protein [Candidatus Acidiferrales bacterium]
MYLAKLDSELIDDPAAPVRAEIDERQIHELAESIREVGLIQPLVVRRVKERYEVIAGHRRLLACRELGLPQIDCLITGDSEETDVTAQRLHENLVRVDMSAVEEALVYAEAFEKLGDLEKVARLAHRSLAVVEDRLALLSGDAGVRAALHVGHLSVGVAHELNKVKDDFTRRFLLKFAVEEGATIDKVRGWRLQYNQYPVQQGTEPERPVSGHTPLPEDDPVNVCWLCGGREDLHDLRVRMVHQYCERIWKRGRMEGIPDGQQS